MIKLSTHCPKLYLHYLTESDCNSIRLVLFPWLLLEKSIKLCSFEQSPGDGEGQGSLVCCSPWDLKELDTAERLNNKNTDTKWQAQHH